MERSLRKQFNLWLKISWKICSDLPSFHFSVLFMKINVFTEFTDFIGLTICNVMYTHQRHLDYVTMYIGISKIIILYIYVQLPYIEYSFTCLSLWRNFI